jgi:hypothetical protein
MAAIIEIMGETVSYDGKHWTSNHPAAARLCENTAIMLPHACYPDRVGGLATAVAKSLRGRVIHIDPVERSGLPPDTKF